MEEAYGASTCAQFWRLEAHSEKEVPAVPGPSLLGLQMPPPTRSSRGPVSGRAHPWGLCVSKLPLLMRWLDGVTDSWTDFSKLRGRQEERKPEHMLQSWVESRTRPKRLNNDEWGHKLWLIRPLRTSFCLKHLSRPCFRTQSHSGPLGWGELQHDDLGGGGGTQVSTIQRTGWGAFSLSLPVLQWNPTIMIFNAVQLSWL